ncbi:MAG: response regulator [Candidatus Nomurabacteria bacterium]|jgi:CheY-like chemotaxis protein|nr:response regulator [Candidatus Nomurabacteria bacterium]
MTKIMLVEDDKSLREIYSIRLVAEGYNIVTAGDGEEALAITVQEKPDLIISDVMMPKISGFDMLDILRSTPETANIKVIMMTALSSEDQRKRGESLGANKYLVKSQVGIEDVVNAVHEVLGDRPTSNGPANIDTLAALQASAASNQVAPTPQPAVAPAPPAPTAPIPTPTAITSPIPTPAAQPTPAVTPAPTAQPPISQAPTPQQVAPQPIPAPAPTNPVSPTIATPTNMAPPTPNPVVITPQAIPTPTTPTPQPPIPAPIAPTPQPIPMPPTATPTPTPKSPPPAPTPSPEPEKPTVSERIIQPIPSETAESERTMAEKMAAELGETPNAGTPQ